MYSKRSSSKCSRKGTKYINSGSGLKKIKEELGKVREEDKVEEVVNTIKQ